jgi:drug/metabolite transporter (DMT)-like permease
LGGQAVRYALGVVVLLLAAFVGRWRLPRPTLVETLVILLLAATGLVGFNLCMLAALRHAEPGAVGVVIGCVPVVLALIGPLLERRVPTARVVFAAVLATLGAAVVEGGGGATALGIALAVGALAGEAAFSLLAAPILPGLGPVAVSLYTCTAAAVMFAAGSPLIEDVGALRSPTLSQAATIAFLGLAVTAGGFIA